MNDEYDQTEFELSWSTTTSALRRTTTIDGMFLGTMIGEALAMGMGDANRIVQLRVFGRPPLRYRMLVGGGTPDRLSHYGFITTQAILRSRQKSEAFLDEFSRRRSWYQLSAPINRLASAIFWKEARLRRETELMVASIYLATLLQGTGARPTRWIQSLAEKTSSQTALPAAILLANAAQFAVLDDRVSTHRVAVWQELASSTKNRNLRQMMQTMTPVLSRGGSVRKAAQLLGWQKGVPPNASAIACVSVYAWIRHPHQFRFAVERAISAGGSSTAVGAFTGALAGISGGRSNMPKEWTSGLRTIPYDQEFFDTLNHRLTDWPHGANDLLRAPAFRSHWMLQIIRNASIRASKLVNAFFRFPCYFAAMFLGLRRRKTRRF